MQGGEKVEVTQLLTSFVVRFYFSSRSLARKSYVYSFIFCPRSFPSSGSQGSAGAPP